MACFKKICFWQPLRVVFSIRIEFCVFRSF